MLSFRSITTSIRVDDQELPYFQADYDEESSTATCWIPSQPGKEFSVWVKKEDETDYDIAAHVYLDGAMHHATTFAIPAHQNEKRRSSIASSSNKEKAFKFADACES